MPDGSITRLRPGVRLIPVTSSNIAAVGYNHDAQKLYVRFLGRSTDSAGSLYEYDEVPVEEWEDLIEVELTRGSVGRAFNERIKRGGFDYRRIE